jgi:hypothetical protein
MNEIEQAKIELREMGLREEELDAAITTLSHIAMNTKLPLLYVVAKWHLFHVQVNS